MWRQGGALVVYTKYFFSQKPDLAITRHSNSGGFGSARARASSSTTWETEAWWKRDEEGTKKKDDERVERTSRAGRKCQNNIFHLVSQALEKYWEILIGTNA